MSVDGAFNRSFWKFLPEILKMWSRVGCNSFTHVRKRGLHARPAVSSLNEERNRLPSSLGKSSKLPRRWPPVWEMAVNSVIRVTRGERRELSPRSRSWACVGKEKSVGEQGYFTVVLSCTGRNIHLPFRAFSLSFPSNNLHVAFQFSVLFLKLLWFNVTHVPIFITADAVPFDMGILGVWVS